ncbi:hypothetical protein MIND_00904200 [Mycena indigotica]|uniref:Uncharacterized protein n=1 Tax=Mycena indigotica TaxID=2126181 RepID=A0A8H6SBY7_9AGAR|nr:uncharacterized protein MIND_00904200 [Mycena indigotica]KAF7296736.1 hypothetical protein MIND_00904200 [Mycena indigotica]
MHSEYKRPSGKASKGIGWNTGAATILSLQRSPLSTTLVSRHVIAADALGTELNFAHIQTMKVSNSVATQKFRLCFHCPPERLPHICVDNLLRLEDKTAEQKSLVQNWMEKRCSMFLRMPQHPSFPLLPTPYQHLESTLSIFPPFHSQRFNASVGLVSWP